MAQAWLCDGESGGWRPQPLTGGAYACVVGPAGSVQLAEAGAAGPSALQLRRVARPGGETWLLLIGPGQAVSVNGARLPLAVYQLRARDEVRLLVPAAAGGEPVAVRFFFATERLAQVVPLPATDKPILCARCGAPVSVGSPAVSCPSCRKWHHQADPCLCWVYRDRCGACDQPTALDAGFRWTPDDL
jgi:hypothetical protein